MDGPTLINFTVARVPELIDEVLALAHLQRKDIELFLMHQATRKMLTQLQTAMEIDEQQMPILLKNCGNTVSSTIPLLIHHLREQGTLQSNMQNMLVGFGVGWSWAGCVWRETWPKT
jgi:3-oxoacyl-[acyl-carrier-protein] synthase-3